MVAGTALQYFVLSYVIHGFQFFSLHNDKPLGHLSQIVSKSSNKPLVVVINPRGNPGAANDDSNWNNRDNNNLYYRNDDNNDRYDNQYRGNQRDVSSIKAIYDALQNKGYQTVFSDILRTNNNDQDSEDIDAQENLISLALRSRCRAKKTCEKRCFQEKRPKPCKKTCKSKIDMYVNCPEEPPKRPKRPKKKKCDSCED